MRRIVHNRCVADESRTPPPSGGYPLSDTEVSELVTAANDQSISPAASETEFKTAWPASGLTARQIAYLLAWAAYVQAKGG